MFWKVFFGIQNLFAIFLLSIIISTETTHRMKGLEVVILIQLFTSWATILGGFK